MKIFIVDSLYVCSNITYYEIVHITFLKLYLGRNKKRVGHKLLFYKIKVKRQKSKSIEF